MYLQHIHLQNIKRIKDLTLEFGDPQNPRLWTVIIGNNGLCKTTILKMMAVASLGQSYAHPFVPIATLKRQKKDDVEIQIEARFYDPMQAKTYHTKLYSQPNARIIKDQYADLMEQRESQQGDRALFVAAYGTQRMLKYVGDERLEPDNWAVARVESLLANKDLLAIRFLDKIKQANKHDKNKKSPSRITAFEYVMEVLKGAQQSALLSDPVSGFIAQKLAIQQKNTDTEDISQRFATHISIGMDASGQDVQDQQDQQDQHHTTTVVRWDELSAGAQSIFALITDIIGAYWEMSRKVVHTKDMVGLVLIDEIDLHIHPKEQPNLVPTLRTIFPKMQFIVTTHAPLVLSSLQPDEVVQLEADTDGYIQKKSIETRSGMQDLPHYHFTYVDEMLRSLFEIFTDKQWHPQKELAEYLNVRVVAQLLSEITPQETVVVRFMGTEERKNTYTAAEMKKEVEEKTKIGLDYITDLFRIARDMLVRQAKYQQKTAQKTAQETNNNTK